MSRLRSKSNGTCDEPGGFGSAAADPIVGDRRSPGGRGPIDHFAVAVDSRATLEQVRDALERLGADIGEIQPLGSEWSLFFRDPDGMELEVCCKAG